MKPNLLVRIRNLITTSAVVLAMLVLAGAWLACATSGAAGSGDGHSNWTEPGP